MKIKKQDLIKQYDHWGNYCALFSPRIYHNDFNYSYKFFCVKIGKKYNKNDYCIVKINNDKFRHYFWGSQNVSLKVLSYFIHESFQEKL